MWKSAVRSRSSPGLAVVAPLTPQQRKAGRVPEVLTTLEEIADAVVQLVTGEALAGRILVWWSGEARCLISQEDRGYLALE